MGGQTTKSTTVENRDPWAPSQPYLLYGLSEAERVYNDQKSKNDPGYTGNFVAQPTGAQISGANSILGNSQAIIPDANRSLNLGAAMSGAGAARMSGAMDTLGSFMNGSNGWGAGVQNSSNALNAFAGVDHNAGDMFTGLRNTNGKIFSFLDGSSGWDKDLGNSISSLNGFSTKDLTGKNIEAAGRYAANPYMDGMVDAATRDAKRAYNETTMPGIDAAAAANGNFNSTRAGVASGIAQRGLQDQVGDISAQMRGNAWTTGLAQSGQDNAQQLSAMQSAGQLADAFTKNKLSATNMLSNNQQSILNNRVALNGQQLSALQAAGGLESSLLGQRLAATNNYGSLGNAMLNGGTAATGLGYQGLQQSADLFNIGSALTTNNNQASIDDALAKQEYANQQPWFNLNNAYNIFANGGQQGGTMVSNSTQKVTQSPLSTLGSMLGVFGSFMKCDRGAKNVLGRVGSLDNGVPVYLFSYKDDPNAQVYMGPMAQELEAVMPDAVIEFDGVKHIDTDILFEALDKKGTLH